MNVVGYREMAAGRDKHLVSLAAFSTLYLFILISFEYCVAENKNLSLSPMVPMPFPVIAFLKESV